MTPFQGYDWFGDSVTQVYAALHPGLSRRAGTPVPGY
jgi:hypothetical protein